MGGPALSSTLWTAHIKCFRSARMLSMVLCWASATSCVSGILFSLLSGHSHALDCRFSLTRLPPRGFFLSNESRGVMPCDQHYFLDRPRILAAVSLARGQIVVGDERTAAAALCAERRRREKTRHVDGESWPAPRGQRSRGLALRPSLSRLSLTMCPPLDRRPVPTGLTVAHRHAESACRELLAGEVMRTCSSASTEGSRATVSGRKGWRSAALSGLLAAGGPE